MRLFSQNRTLCLLVLQIMLLAQVFIAQHATVHFMENGPTSAAEYIHQDNGHSDHGKSNADCQACLVAKSLQNLLTGPAQVITPPSLQPDLAAVFPHSLTQKPLAGYYNARAPPPLLS
jgi:hypothetical protein